MGVGSTYRWLRVSRRALLRGGASGALGLGAGGVLAGCAVGGKTAAPTAVSYPATLVFQPLPRGLGNVDTSFALMQ